MAKKKGKSVGVIGLGSMGLGVARTLLAKGFQVHAFDVRPEVLKAFAKQGGIAAANPAEVGANSPVLIVLVVNAEQTEEALFGRNGAAPRARQAASSRSCLPAGGPHIDWLSRSSTLSRSRYTAWVSSRAWAPR